MRQATLDENYQYSVKELSFIWNISKEWVRRMVVNEPGVIAFRVHTPGKRVYRTYRVPGWVAKRIQERFTVVAKAR